MPIRAVLYLATPQRVRAFISKRKHLLKPLYLKIPANLIIYTVKYQLLYLSLSPNLRIFEMGYLMQIMADISPI